MAFEIEWLRGAQDELDAEIAYVLGEFGLFAARKAYQRIKTNVNRLETFPLIGSIYPNLTYKGCEVRKLVIRQVTVFYSPQPDRVTILAVWNNFQNPARIPNRLSTPE
jgi:plasmid stabilization system protein ParE